MAKFGYVSDLTPAQIKADQKWMARAQRRAKIGRAQRQTKSFVEKNATTIVLAAAAIAGSWIWLAYKKRTTGSYL